MFKLRKPKSVYSILVLTILIISLLCPVVYADDSSSPTMDQKLIEEMNEANDAIFELIAEAQYDAQKEIDKAEIQIAKFEGNQDRIEKIEADLDKKIDKICDKLVEKTDKVVDKLRKKAAKEGVEIHNFYIEVEVGGRLITVDPFYAH